MKVGIFVGDDCTQGVQRLLKALERRDIPASAFRLSHAWSDVHTDEIRHNFATISHAVFLVSEGCAGSSWFPFVVGFCMGRDITVVLYGGNTSIPAFLSGYERFSNVTALSDFLEQELLIYQKTQRVEEAQAELRAAGFSATERSFADAVEQGSLSAVRSFLRVGISPDARDETGIPVLSLAVRQGHQEIVSLLIGHGADVNAVSEDRDNSPLMEAATRGDEKAVRALMEAGADPDVTTKYNQTALMLAIGEGHTEVVKYLLDRGARTDVVDYLGMTAEKYAKLFRSGEILSLLHATED